METCRRMSENFGSGTMSRMNFLSSYPVFFESGPIIHSHREVEYSALVQPQQPKVIVINNGVLQPQNATRGQGQSTRGASTTGAMTASTREIKDLEAEKRRLKRELEKKKQRCDIEDIKRQIDDEDRSSSSRILGDTKYNSQHLRVLPPAPSTTQSTSQPTRIDHGPTDLYWSLGLVRETNPTPSQIYSAYQNCRKEHHHDRVKHKDAKGKEHSANRMREIVLAKSVLLGDAERKRAYDEDGVVQQREFQAWMQRKQVNLSGSRTFVPGQR